MTAHKRPIVLKESLIGRGAAEGVGRLLWIIGVSAFKHGVAFAAVFMSFVGLWHLRMHGAVAVGMITGACCLGMITGMTARIAVLLIGREMAVYPGRYVILYDGGHKGRRWSFEQVSDVRILDGPKQWTTVEIDIWRSPRRPTIRFVAKCTEEERNKLKNALAIGDRNGGGALEAGPDCETDSRRQQDAQREEECAPHNAIVRYRILAGMLIATYVLTISLIVLSALVSIVGRNPALFLLGLLGVAFAVPAFVALYYLKAQLKKGRKGRGATPGSGAGGPP